MVVAKKIIPAQTIASSVTTYYTGPANVRTLVKKFTLTNPGATALTFTIYIVPAAGTYGLDNVLIYQKTIAALQTLEVFEIENHVIEMDQRIQMIASTGSVLVVQASGVELT